MTDTTIDFVAEAARIQKELETNLYLTYDSNSKLHLYGNAEKIHFCKNVASEGPPDRESAKMRLLGIYDFFKKLVEASEEFRNFVGNKRFIASIELMSGHMEYTYATLEDGNMTFD